MSPKTAPISGCIQAEQPIGNEQQRPANNLPYSRKFSDIDLPSNGVAIATPWRLIAIQIATDYLIDQLLYRILGSR